MNCSSFVVFKLYCSPNYYGGDCEIICVPNLQRYDCDLNTGEKICKHGYFGPECLSGKLGKVCRQRISS